MPIGFGASPALANFVLSSLDINGVRDIVKTVMTAKPGQLFEMPFDNTVQVRLLDLVDRLARCCRHIEDVLFLHMGPGEVQFCIDKMYDLQNTGLDLKCECATRLGDGAIH